MIGLVVPPSLVSSSKKAKFEGDNEAIALSGSAVLLASGFGNGLNYAFGIFLARTLGAEEFGLFVGLTIFNMVTLTVIFGMDIGATKFVSHHLGKASNKAKESLLAAASIAFGSGFVSLPLDWHCSHIRLPCDALQQAGFGPDSAYIFYSNPTCHSDRCSHLYVTGLPDCPLHDPRQVYLGSYRLTHSRWQIVIGFISTPRRAHIHYFGICCQYRGSPPLRLSSGLGRIGEPLAVERSRGQNAGLLLLSTRYLEASRRGGATLRHSHLGLLGRMHKR